MLMTYSKAGITNLPGPQELEHRNKEILASSKSSGSPSPNRSNSPDAGIDSAVKGQGMLSEYFAQSSSKLDVMNNLNKSKYQVYLKTQRVVSGHQFRGNSRTKHGPLLSSGGQRISQR